MKKRLNQPIAEQTLNEIYGLLPAKGLDPDMAPAEFAENHGLKTRELEGLTESQGLALLDWLGQIPDDQPVEPAGAPEGGAEAGAADDEGSSGAETEADGNGHAKDEISKAEGSLWIKRPLTFEEHQGSLNDLYELESRRTSLEFELDGHKAKVKACQKEIESIDTETYRIIRNIKANEIGEEVPALRVTNHTAGMIFWYHRDTGEVLRERAIANGEQLPLDLSGEPDQSTPTQPEGPAPDEGQPETEGAPADNQAADDDAEPPLAAGPAADEFGPPAAEDVMPF